MLLRLLRRALEQLFACAQRRALSGSGGGS
jgi:hypothetical protein